MARVLGIDPGTLKTGWGVIETSGPRATLIAAGVIHAKRAQALELRLETIHVGLAEVIAIHAPASVAVEDVFFAKHANAALKLGHARGVALLAAASAGLSVHAYAPALVKKTVAGRGAAKKEQVARLVGALLGIRSLPAEDACDALAIAITHMQAMRAQDLQRRVR